MQDLRDRVDKFIQEAADCDLIANFATDPMKRRTFRRLAVQFRQMAADISAAAEAEQQWIGQSVSCSDTQASRPPFSRDHRGG